MNSLEKIEDGQKVVIKRIESGYKMKERMSVLNIREGKMITKIASQPLKGPIVIMIGETRCAIGRGMAKKIFVE